MNTIEHNPNIRRGQFLWRDGPAKQHYIEKLQRRISEGYYFSDNIVSRVVDEIAPVFRDGVEDDYASHW